MDIGEPPPDPFPGMSPEERKRAQETAILEMAYDLSKFARVEARERPDFALCRSGKDTPFGVEITQLFPNESHARLNLVHGYHQRLWSGGAHLHKSDVTVLQSMTVDIKDRDGNVKQSGVPAILTETPGPDAFRATMCDAIRGKAAKRYGLEGLTHLNLVILDWFDLPFDATRYLTDRFFDNEVRAALKECPFREVFLLTAGTRDESEGETAAAVHPYLRLIPLQQLLAMERVYVTGHIIDEECRGNMRDVAHLNALVIDHVSRVQGYGEPVECQGRPFLRYGGATVEISERGMQVRDHQDSPMSFLRTEMTDRMDPSVEERVTERANANVFQCGYAPRANRPSTWLTG